MDTTRTYRTALTTCAFTPRRHRVLVAKSGAVVALSVAVTPLALLAAVVVWPVGSLASGDAAARSADAGALAMLALAVTGYALALAIDNAPTSIVIVLTWPILKSMLRTASRRSTGWPLPKTPGALLWPSLSVWVALPALIGFRRGLQAQAR